MLPTERQPNPQVRHGHQSVRDGTPDEVRQRDVYSSVVTDLSLKLQQRSGIDVDIPEELRIRG